MTVHVYIVDDDACIRDELAELIDAGGYKTFRFGTGSAFVEAAETLLPGCVILDHGLPGMSGIDVFERLAASDSGHRVVMLTGLGEVPVAVSAMRLGAVDFLEKPCSPSKLLAAIASTRAVLERDQVFRQRRDTARESLGKLTPRELEVGDAVCRGGTSKEIARDLCISPRTVDNHRASLTTKLNVKSIPELLRLFVESELLPPAEDLRGALPDE